jgi:hypothetical protein
VEYNVVELTVVNMTFGKSYGGGTKNLALVARNIKVDSYSLVPIRGDVIVKVDGYEAATGTRQESSLRLSTLGLDQNIQTIVRVSIFHIEIAMEGM